MAVISAAILSKTKTLVSRQYVTIPKLRVEAILSTFLTLIERQGSSRAKTILESDSVNYLFVPIETIYLVLVTDKGSNIIMDTETLRTFQEVVVDLVPGIISPEAIASVAYKILFAMDELIASGGHRELVAVAQVKEYLAMESAEEKLQNLIRQSKEAEENERRRKRAQELDREKLKRMEAEKAFLKHGGQRQGPHTNSSPSSVTMMQAAAAPLAASPPLRFDFVGESAGAGMAPKKGMVLGKKRGL